MPPAHHLPFSPSAAVARCLGTLGRTEDVVFSPDETRLAIAGFTENKILVIQIKVVTENGAMCVQSDHCVELHCADFKKPHGISWIDADTLVVANRKGDVIVVPVPAATGAGQVIRVEPLLRLSEGQGDLIRSPGSVDIVRFNDQDFDILVCNNYQNYVSRHIVQRRNGIAVLAGARLFEHDLKVPDSIAISSDGDLVAVSNHDRQRIDVFPNHADSGTQTQPLFSLGVASYPHGLRFAMDDRLILVADAGAPFVHVFARDGVAWKTAGEALVSLKIMEDDTFRRGQSNPQEGGPKGLDVLDDGSMFVVSCEEVPIAFFDFRPTRDQLTMPETVNQRQRRTKDRQLLDTAMATLKAQQDQIATLQTQVPQLNDRKPVSKPSLDRRLVDLLERLAQAAGAKR